MSTFDKRQEGFEKKFALDEEQKFKAEARRNKLLGLWAAELLGKTGDDAAAYAKEVVASDFEEAGDTDVLRKVRTSPARASRSRRPQEDGRVGGCRRQPDQGRTVISQTE
jgi:hypothetical protein